MHPVSHLWDNQNNPTLELERIIKLRKEVLQNFGVSSIPDGTPYSELEKILVPIYLMHRYQVDATSKLIGGVDFDYSVKEKATGSSFQEKIKTIPEATQKEALDLLLKTIEPEFLILDQRILNEIPPPAFGYGRTRETFNGNTGSLFDPIAAAEASANHTLKFLLNPQRLSRVNLQSLPQFDLSSYFSKITKTVFSKNKNHQVYRLMLQKLLAVHYLKLAGNTKIDQAVAAEANFQLIEIRRLLAPAKKKERSNNQAHPFYINDLIYKFENKPESFKLPSLPSLPPGSPIGCH